MLTACLAASFALVCCVTHPTLEGALLFRLNHLQQGRGRLGGADRDRTDDPLLAKQVLSQLSYSPIGSRREE